MMTGHTPTMFASIALVASIMAFCLMLVRYPKQGRGMLTTGFGLLCHALAYGGFALYGQVPLWLSYSAANTLLALAVAFYTASVPRIQGRQVALWPIFVWPLLMMLLQTALLHTREPRMLAACGVLIAQCVVLVHHSRQQVLPGGRAHLLLIVSSVISAGTLTRTERQASGFERTGRDGLSGGRLPCVATTVPNSSFAIRQLGPSTEMSGNSPSRTGVREVGVLLNESA